MGEMKCRQFVTARRYIPCGIASWDSGRLRETLTQPHEWTIIKESGEIGEIPPNVRMWGIPLKLTDIREE
jgi:hypothetical protein